MFFRERCSLCGGKLDGNKICTECGLDNNKSERHYRVNQSSCDGQPLTHVHKEERYSGNADQNRQRQAEKRTRQGRRKKILLVIVILVVLVAVLPTLLNRFGDSGPYSGSYSADYDYDYTYDDYDYDPYAYVTREMPSDGESYSQQFAQGDYTVGVHIPEGTYAAECSAETYVSLSVDDEENGIYLYESLDEETPRVEDIRLYTGAVVTVTGDGDLTLTADNAQTDQMGGQPNPLTESAVIRGGQEVTAGEDFPAGVYDIRAASGYGSPEITVYDGEGNEIRTLYVWVSDSSETESSYRNAVLPEGTVILNEYEDLDLELVPSQTIESEDYLDHYLYD